MFHVDTVREKSLWKSDCPVAIDRLRDITVSYYDFQEEPHHDGHIIVLDAIVKHTVQVFRRLYEMKFPIAKIRPIYEYHSDDEASMRDNNTSGFHCRPRAGYPPGSLPSLHAYGLAIDINPVQNPYIRFNKGKQGTAEIFPVSGEDYMNRHCLRAGMVESIVDIFKECGFTEWGGQWNSPIDYQHFQVPRVVAEKLARLNPGEAENFFETSLNRFP